MLKKPTIFILSVLFLSSMMQIASAMQLPDPPPSPSPSGACCSSNGTCSEQSELQCGQLDNDFLPGQTCDPNPCLPFSVCESLNYGDCYQGDTCPPLSDPAGPEGSCPEGQICCGGETHLECVGDQCQEKYGGGDDQCSTDQNCAIQKHTECVDYKCKTVDGAGGNQCQTDPNCEPFGYYYRCYGGQCELAHGQGMDECSSHAQCDELPEHYECQESLCIKVFGPGPDWCTRGENCGQNPVHNVCVDEKCVQIDGIGPNRCTHDSGCPSPLPPDACQHECMLEAQCILIGGTPTDGECPPLSEDTLSGGSTCCDTTNVEPRPEPPMGDDSGDGSLQFSFALTSFLGAALGGLIFLKFLTP